MATSYPTSKQSFTNPTDSDTLDSPNHADLHSDLADTVEAIQDVIGTGAGLTLSGTYDPKLLFVLKGSDEAVTSNTTAQNDDELFLAVEANKTYLIEAVVFYDGDASGDIKMGFTGPSGASGNLGWLAAPNTASSGVESNYFLRRNAVAGTIPAGCIGASDMAARAYGVLSVGANAGNYQFVWAQNVSSGTATNVLAGSYLSLREVA